ncbi:PREDICTED: uncharacterized protein C1orf101 homolog [Propithecus coquereli]|uniref:Catsper channel auxiliary subunit epsilon n=1 Tax=Propithecus coquereli TaxID=379532 RepID=A0A2K6EQ04_PROCO|nr:PREDICTED: uncharacterized protein C1orf101 homolog [Propithecus coquereli]
MSVPGVGVLLSWLSCCSLALWRYYSNSPNYNIFSTRSTIKLEYEGTSFSEWSVPETCSMQDKRSPTTELRCSSPGIQAIKPIVAGPDEEERYLYVDSSHTCFMWHYRTISFFENLTHVIIIWVFDPEHANPDELLGNAEEPSRNSIVLSTQLATLGQKPTIFTILRRKVYVPDGNINNGTWRITVPMTRDDVLKEIKGNQVTFQDCFIADAFFLLTSSLLTMPEIPGFLPISSQTGSQLISSWNPCVPSCAVVVADTETYQTNDSFHTWTRIRVPPNVLSDDERQSVAHVTLLHDGIFFIINGILYLKSFHAFKRLGRNENIPDGGIMGITSRKWCWIKYLLKNKGRRSNMVIWTENEVYLGYTSLEFVRIVTTAELKILLNLSPSATLTVHNIEYTGHPLELAVLLNYCIMCTVTKNIFIVIYNEDTKQWVFQDFMLDVPIDSFLVPHFLFSATPELVMHDKHRIYYCYHNFTVTGVLQTPTENGNLSMLSNDSIIHEVFVDYYGNIVVKMENNIIFYFKMSITDAIKLHVWVNSTIRTTFLLRTSGHIYLLHAFDNGTIQAQEYPLKLEAQSIAFKTKDKCPYTAFNNNVARIFYFLDKRDILNMWTQLVYPENVGLYTIVELYGPKILKIQQYTHYEIAFGHCTKTLTLTFSQNINYEGVDNYFQLQDQNTGLLLIQLRPSAYSKTCARAHKVFQMAVGCDIYKYITVKGFSKKGCLYHDFTYVIEKSYLRHRPSQNLKVRYDWEEYGCPLRLEFTEKFQPVIQLFNDNGFIQDVEANFIVWEIHGRDDYSFNTTMKQNGCLSEAQTWKSMIELNKHLPLEEVWGPQNYRHCFSYAVGKPGDLTQPYEIINSSNNNHIFWPLGHSGMYVFRVKILDPNYSFCNLTAVFAIETFGAIPSPGAYLVAAFLFILMLLFFTLLVLSYFRYMNIYRRHIYEPLHKPPKPKKS